MSVELWGGVEATVNRVGDVYFDQMAMSGHADRLSDLERFADLGIRRLRYPVLWERIAPHGLAKASWTWADERLGRLRELGIQPIVGLVHHGSGPRHTSLVDRAFPDLLAEYAHAVAERYPWVEAYTPVNEPLTTARFSALYGHWYPHGRDYASFFSALLNQCRGVLLAMRAIRSVNPRAALIQTEDMGETFSTPRLAYQATFENHRRLLSLDLLSGLLDAGHPLLGFMRQHGVRTEDIDWFAAHACPPDIIGLNYYLTSDRLLDERMTSYPAWSHGGNDRDRYADIEAVRVWGGGISGFGRLLERLWTRYRRPVAITEAHLGCTRDEQLRWFLEAWGDAVTVRQRGVDVRAVTMWSLLGAYDWNKLVVRTDGFYEPGAYDVRGPAPRPTALARMIQRLAKDGHYDHPVLAGPSWWRRADRFHYPVVGVSHEAEAAASQPGQANGAPNRPPVLIIGANGTLGQAFARACRQRGLAHRLLSRRELDIGNRDSIAVMMRDLRPWAVINAAGYVRVDAAEADCEGCYRDNAVGAANLAEACQRAGTQYLTFSSDLVFDGAQARPYVESQPVAPLNVYGLSKAEAERRVLTSMPSALVVRTSAFFGPWDAYNFVTMTLDTLAGDRPFHATEAMISPTYVPDLVHTSLDLLIDKASGLWHIANQGGVTWVDLAKRTAELAGLNPALIEARDPVDLGLLAPRPLYSVLGSERGTLLPSWEQALDAYFRDRRADAAAGDGRGRVTCAA